MNGPGSIADVFHFIVHVPFLGWILSAVALAVGALLVLVAKDM